MSKTIETQIEKTKVLIEGLRKNLDAVRDKGINEELLDRLEQEINKLTEQNAACDAARNALSQQVREMNAVMDNVKSTFAETKKIIKCYYPQEEWVRYGVMDKR